LAKLRTRFKPYSKDLQSKIQSYKDKISTFKDGLKENRFYQTFINPVIVWLIILYQTIIGLNTY